MLSIRPERSICTALTCPSARQELRVGEARADHQQRVGFLHHVPARLGSEQSDAAGAERDVVRHGGLAQQGLGDSRPEIVGDRDHLVGGMQRALSDEHRDTLAAVQDLRGLLELIA